MKTVWVVTRAINEYDQDGEYFVGVFSKQPTFHDLKILLPSECDDILGKLTRGGGRHNLEYEWFYLKEVEFVC